MLSYLKNLMETKNNYSNYRQLMKNRLEKTQQEATLPYLGIFLRDLTFSGEHDISYSLLTWTRGCNHGLHRFLQRDNQFWQDDVYRWTTDQHQEISRFYKEIWGSTKVESGAVYSSLSIPSSLFGRRTTRGAVIINQSAARRISKVSFRFQFFFALAV